MGGGGRGWRKAENLEKTFDTTFRESFLCCALFDRIGGIGSVKGEREREGGGGGRERNREKLWHLHSLALFCPRQE